MKIALTRSGGFAGITLHRELDTARLPPRKRKSLEKLAARVRSEPASPASSPDAFQHEITIDGVRYLIGDPAGAWLELIEHLTK